MNVRVGLVVTVSAIACLSTGCTLQTSDADKYRSAVPQSKDIALGVPGSSAAGTAAQSARGLRLSGTHASGLGVTGLGAGGNAEFYQFTRDITDGVDVVTVVILGAINAVVAQTPTTVGANQAVWGPYQGDALQPVVWRFTVNEVAPNEYDYKLEGRPKDKTAESDFVSVLTGHGYGKEAGALHRTGWFQADNDAYRTLDPARGHDYGTTKITYDLKNLDDPSIAGEIDADLAPGQGKGNLAIKVHHLTGGAGELDITGKAALDNTKPTVLEDVNLKNRWDTTGAGRADVVATGGTLPSELDVVECWSSSFSRVYYTDNLNISKTEGDATACKIAK